MRLQHLVYGFLLQSGDEPKSKLLTSTLIVNGNNSKVTLSELFFGNFKERDNTIKGYSILEFLDENGNIQINDKIYNLSFQSDEEIFLLKSVVLPSIQLSDKELSDEEVKTIENKIEGSAPSEIPMQPQEEKTDENLEEAAPTIFENEEYEEEKEDLIPEGYVEFNTEPKSNFRLLVKQRDDKKFKAYLIELLEDDYQILELDEYKIDLNLKQKQFTWEKISQS